jgi:hypothetical protein
MALRPHGLPSRICPPAIATCRLPCVYLAGGHRSLETLRSSRSPSLKSSKTMPSWGRHATHSTGTSEMCRPCCDHATTSSAARIRMARYFFARVPCNVHSVSHVGASIHCAAPVRPTISLLASIVTCRASAM